MNKIIVGQRYMSVAEPELGLGIISQIEDKSLVVSFPASEEARRYGMKTAPLKRIQFDIGDDLSSNEGQTFVISEITHSESGLLVYLGDREEDIMLECDVLDSIGFHKPEEKLLSGLRDRGSLFQLRFDTFRNRAWLAANKMRGFIGGRLSLIDHQYYLADKVTNRLYPRVLLADEVGLGKTIETGLILHKLLITGRVERVLIVTPNTLNFQWFIEMLRKYNLSFSVVNEQTELESGTNPFDENNLVITSMELLCGSERARGFVNKSQWDLLIVDEAHKLYWKTTGPSIQYTVVEEMARKIKGLILLTATPEIYGLEGHFSHLKLIDPDRFQSFEEFSAEEKGFKEIARQGRELIDSKNLTSADKELASLIDCHGPGRVYFRNTRDVIDRDHHFFPKRVLKSYKLKNDKILNFEEEKPRDDFYKSKILWLIDLLKDLNGEKVLLICHSQKKVIQIEKDLKEMTVGNKIGVFHEELSLMARDRQAAYFRDPDGSNILLCSEIGSEGRNFQFCQNLILMDLPKNPDLLEQRIGRLDRVGQKNEIYIHAPYLENSWEEIIFNWYESVFSAFTSSAKGAMKITEKYDGELQSALLNVDESLNGDNLNKLIDSGKSDFIELTKELQDGRDVLIELNSFNKEVAHELTNNVREIDQSCE